VTEVKRYEFGFIRRRKEEDKVIIQKKKVNDKFHRPGR
jgi:hypothetical protein